MINVYGTESTEEYHAAKRLKELIERDYPSSSFDEQTNIDIIANVKCIGESTKDVDLAVFITSHPVADLKYKSQICRFDLSNTCI